MDTEKNPEQIKASPSKINLYERCPRQFYLRYIEGIIPPKNIHILKGNIIHKTLENFFKRYEKKLKKRMDTLFELEFNLAQKDISELNLSEIEIKNMHKDSQNMLTNFLHKFSLNVKMLIEGGKAGDKKHAFFLLRPKNIEKWYEDTDLNVCGIIDYSGEDFDGNFTVGDYKTANKFGFSLKSEYERALKIYAYLVNKIDKIFPHWLAINYVRFGDVDRFRCTTETIKEGRDLVINFHENTKSRDITDYPKTDKPIHCGNRNFKCDFFDICNGEKDYQETKRRDQLKHKFGKKTE